MGKKHVRIVVTDRQASTLLRGVFSKLRLSGEDRRRVVRRELPLPTDGSRVDLFCEGKFVEAMQRISSRRKT